MASLKVKANENKQLSLLLPLITLMLTKEKQQCLSAEPEAAALGPALLPGLQTYLFRICYMFIRQKQISPTLQKEQELWLVPAEEAPLGQAGTI